MLSTLPCKSALPKPQYFVMPQSKFLELINNNLNTNPEDNFRKEIIYRKNSHNVERINFYDKLTGKKVKTKYFDYFNDKKVKLIDEFDIETGKKIRSTDYTVYKSITEYNPKTGKKLKTYNYSMRDENKIVSIHEYHSIYDKVSRISIFRPDGKSISMVKEINPLTEHVEQCINYKRNSNVVSSVSKYEFQENKMVKTTCYYTDYAESIREFTGKTAFVTDEEKQKTARLIDNLFRKNLNFKTLQI